MRTILRTLLLMLLGGVVTLGAILVASWVYQKPRPREEDLRRQYLLKHTQIEQASQGINCLTLSRELRGFLATGVRPILDSRSAGQGWGTHVGDRLGQEIDKYRNFIQTCARLYEIGENGTLNGLEELAYVPDLSKQYFTLYTLLKFGAPTKQTCDARCADEMFLELRSTYEKVLTLTK